MARKEAIWRRDWEQFIRHVVADLAAGLSAEDVSQKYCDQAAEWTGKIASVCLLDVPAARLDMPPVNVEMPDGRHCTVNYLSLLIKSEEVDAWKSVKPGQKVKFRTSVSKGMGPFPGLSWVDLGEKEGYVSIRTNGGKLLQVLDAETQTP